MKALKMIVIFVITISQYSCEKDDKGNTTINGDAGTVVDIDNNTYKIVKIGKQWWMAENLKTTQYANGEAIPFVESDSVWRKLDFSDKGFCYYDNSLTNAATYGALYNWAAAMNGDSSSVYNPSGVQGVCPAGWHLPSNEEWLRLIDYLGRAREASGKLKESGTMHWEESSAKSTNESGFTALPGGNRDYKSGGFQAIGYIGSWWSATKAFDYGFLEAYHMNLSYDNGYTIDGTYFSPAGYAYCVRCVMD